MTSTSTASAISSRAHSQAVPAARFASPVGERLGHVLVRGGLDDALVRATVAWVGLLDPADGARRLPCRRPAWFTLAWFAPARSAPAGPLVGRAAHRAEQVGDHLVAVGRHADAPAARQEVEDHPSARIGLAAARRPLHRQHRAVEPRGDPQDGVEGRLAFADEIRSACRRRLRPGARRAPDARRNAPQQVERRPPRAVRREAPGGDLLRQPEQAVAQHPGVDAVERHERRWMGDRRRAAALQVDCPRDVVERDDLAAEAPALLVGLGGGRVLRRIADLDLVGLLREAVAVDDGALHLPRLAGRGQPAERRPVGDQLLLVEAAAVEELPPRGLVLPPVEVQEVRQQAARPLAVIQRRLVRGQPGGQRVEQRLDLGGPFPLLLALVLPQRRPRHGFAGQVLELAAAGLQPLAEAQGRQAVVPVVALYLRAQLRRHVGGLTGLQPRLEPDERPRRGRQIDVAREAVEGLQLLDRVALDRRAQPLPDHAVQVHEHPPAQQPVHLVLAGGVAAHQALDGRGLVRGVVIDVEVRVLRPTRHEPVDEVLERAPLGRRVERPARLVAAVAVHGAEEVLQAAVPREGVALDVEEDVAGRGRRQCGQPPVRLDRRDQLVDAAPLPARLNLDPRLVADAGERGGADAVDRRLHRQAQGAEIRHRGHSPLDEPAPLAAGDAGDQRQMVVRPPPVRADSAPVAEPAVLDRLRVGPRRRVRMRLEAPPDGAVVRRVLGHPEARVDPPLAPAQRQVHPLRLGPLHALQQVRVQQELQQRRTLGRPRELRIDHLVRPVAQPARPLHPNQEVGVPAPAPVRVLQPALVDDARPPPHRLHGARRGRGAILLRERHADRGYGLHGAALGGEPLQQTLLVLDAALPQHVRARVVVGRRPLDLAERDGAAQARQVAAGEVAAQIGGRERQPPALVSHGARP